MEAYKKQINFEKWYSQVITKAEMVEFVDKSGCYILLPWSYSIWELITKFFNSGIKKLEVQECYFPALVNKNALEIEITRIASRAPKAGNSNLAEPIALTKYLNIEFLRDLPLKMNQWNNIARLDELKYPQPFLRTREYLWHEGHSAIVAEKEAIEEVHKILDLYAELYTNLLAIPVVKGKKTEKEKLAVADFTTTVIAFISANGRGIKGATSHHLGNNFSKMFETVVQDAETKEKKYSYRNSWGITSHTIGVMVMMHSDDKGLVLPPNVALVQVIIIPCGIDEETCENAKDLLMQDCQNYEKILSEAGIRVKGDYDDHHSCEWKFNHWESKGVPLRLEISLRDEDQEENRYVSVQEEYVAVRRDTGEKLTRASVYAAQDIRILLDKIQSDLLNKATKELKDHMITVDNFRNFLSELDKKNILLAPFCGEVSCEEKIEKESTKDDNGGEPGAPAMGAKSLCIPFKQPDRIKQTAKCIYPTCTNKPKYYCLFGRSY